MKKIKVPDADGEPIKCEKYNTENDLVFSGIELGLVNSILCGRVDNHRTTKYCRTILIYVNVYQ